MATRVRYVSMLIAVLGIASLVLGVAFVGLAIQKNDFVAQSLREQNVTLGLTQAQIAQGQVVDNAQEAQVAANMLAQHLKSLAPTYGDLMAASSTGKYDPTNPADLTYTQGLNMENAFNLAVLSFGVIQEVMVTGAALMVIGLAVGATGVALFTLSKAPQEALATAPGKSLQPASETTL